MSARVPRQQRGEHRRDALLAAAVQVISAGGPAAFSARSVAATARLPLAAVSYYFPRLDDLLGPAIAVVVRGWIDHGDAVVRALEAATCRTGDEPAAGTITGALLPPGDDTAIRHRYEHLLAAAAHPVAAAAMADLRPQLQVLVKRVLLATRTSSVIGADALVALVDGAAVGAISEHSEGQLRDGELRNRIASTVRAALVDG